MVKKISEKEFEEVSAAKLAIVDFSAKWCGPCKMLSPIFHEISEEMSDIAEFYNVDVDESSELAEKFGVTNIPALIVLKEGKRVDIQVGFQPKSYIENFIRSQI